MIWAAVLLCLSGMARESCTIKTAEEVSYFRAPVGACGLAGQTIIAGQAGDRAATMFVKTICNVRRENNR